MKKRIALLSGGISSEREVSINSGNQVFEALDKEKYDVVRYDPKTDLKQLVVDALEIDAALVILHGPFGEDGTVQGLLELLNIPYQGSGVLGSAVAMDKLLSKQLYELSGLKVPPYVLLGKKDAVDEDSIVSEVGLPLVTKPRKGGSSIGMALVKDRKDIAPAVFEALKYDDEVLLEAYIEGIELTGGVIGNAELEALPIIEIVPEGSHQFFDYAAKYKAGETREICPAGIDEEMTAKAMDCALKAHRALYLEGYSRTDMILKDREIYVLETNTIPGMTATSLLPQAAAAAGYSFSGLLDRLIELSLEKA